MLPDVDPRGALFSSSAIQNNLVADHGKIANANSAGVEKFRKTSKQHLAAAMTEKKRIEFLPQQQAQGPGAPAQQKYQWITHLPSLFCRIVPPGALQGKTTRQNMEFIISRSIRYKKGIISILGKGLQDKMPLFPDTILGNQHPAVPCPPGAAREAFFIVSMGFRS
jgi:hypothetical protein